MGDVSQSLRILLSTGGFFREQGMSDFYKRFHRARLLRFDASGISSSFRIDVEGLRLGVFSLLFSRVRSCEARVIDSGDFCSIQFLFEFDLRLGGSWDISINLKSEHGGMWHLWN